MKLQVTDNSNLATSIVTAKLIERYGEYPKITDIINLCNENPIYREACIQNHEIALVGMRRSISLFEHVRNDVGANYFEHVQRVIQGISYLYQAIQTGQDGPYPVYKIEPFFGSADLETQLAIEENMGAIYDIDGLRYQQRIHVPGTPLAVGSKGYLVKTTQMHTENRPEYNTYVIVADNIIGLENVLTNDFMNEFSTHHYGNGAYPDLKLIAHGRNEQNPNDQVPDYETLDLPSTLTDRQRLEIIRDRIRMMITTESTENREYWIILRSPETESFYSFNIGKFEAVSGIEDNRENLNSRMIQCFKDGCPTDYDYWRSHIYEFLGNTATGMDDYWKINDQTDRAWESVDSFGWAEWILLQRKAYRDFNWMEHVKSLLTGQVHRYYIEFEDQNILNVDKPILNAHPFYSTIQLETIPNNTIKFEIYGTRPINGQIGILMQPFMNDDTDNSDANYSTGFNNIAVSKEIMFLGPDEISIMRVIKQYIAVIHRRSIISTWVSDEDMINFFDPDNIELDIDGHRYTMTYPYPNPNRVPWVEDIVASRRLEIGENIWKETIYQNGSLIFRVENKFILTRVVF